MDNLTHSLTGAVTAKFIESRPSAPEEKARFRRVFFWLFVLSANTPDIDVLFGLTMDPISSIAAHRGLTHSILFAPVLALLPALLFRSFSPVRNIRLLWIVSLLGIVLHIFFDLVTSFGTRILTPLSDTRFSLDWLFIIDPVFTFVLAITLFFGWKWPLKRTAISTAGVLFMGSYVVVAAFSHGFAVRDIRAAAQREGISWTRISAIPQPLSIFSWQGLVQTEEGVRQCFFSFPGSGPESFSTFRHQGSEFAVRAAGEPAVRWYLSFARHPLVTEFREGETTVVEYRDMLFSIDESLTRALGFTERSVPFILRVTYDESGNLLAVSFDGEEVLNAGSPSSTESR